MFKAIATEKLGLSGENITLVFTSCPEGDMSSCSIGPYVCVDVLTFVLKH